MIWIEVEPGTCLLLTDKNEPEVKAFLYSKFEGDKELILKQEGFEDERLKLEDLFNVPESSIIHSDCITSKLFNRYKKVKGIPF